MRRQGAPRLSIVTPMMRPDMRREYEVLEAMKAACGPPYLCRVDKTGRQGSGWASEYREGGSAQKHRRTRRVCRFATVSRGERGGGEGGLARAGVLYPPQPIIRGATKKRSADRWDMHTRAIFGATAAVSQSGRREGPELAPRMAQDIHKGSMLCQNIACRARGGCSRVASFPSLPFLTREGRRSAGRSRRRCPRRSLPAA